MKKCVTLLLIISCMHNSWLMPMGITSASLRLTNFKQPIDSPYVTPSSGITAAVRQAKMQSDLAEQAQTKAVSDYMKSSMTNSVQDAQNRASIANISLAQDSQKVTPTNAVSAQGGFFFNMSKNFTQQKNNSVAQSQIAKPVVTNSLLDQAVGNDQAVAGLFEQPENITPVQSSLSSLQLPENKNINVEAGAASPAGVDEMINTLPEVNSTKMNVQLSAQVQDINSMTQDQKVQALKIAVKSAGITTPGELMGSKNLEYTTLKKQYFPEGLPEGVAPKDLVSQSSVVENSALDASQLKSTEGVKEAIALEKLAKNQNAFMRLVPEVINLTPEQINSLPAKKIIEYARTQGIDLSKTGLSQAQMDTLNNNLELIIARKESLPKKVTEERVNVSTDQLQPEQYVFATPVAKAQRLNQIKADVESKTKQAIQDEVQQRFDNTQSARIKEELTTEFAAQRSRYSSSDFESKIQAMLAKRKAEFVDQDLKVNAQKNAQKVTDAVNAAVAEFESKAQVLSSAKAPQESDPLKLQQSQIRNNAITDVKNNIAQQIQASFDVTGWRFDQNYTTQDMQQPAVQAKLNQAINQAIQKAYSDPVNKQLIQQAGDKAVADWQANQNM